jgi:UDP-glucose 4-epimerase
MKPVSLVTGGAGFIGSYVVDELVKAGHRVVVVDDLSGGDSGNVSVLAHLVKCSVENDDIESLFEYYKFDYVFHLAAYAAEGLSHFIRRFNYRNNLIGSVNLINAAVNHGVKCFVFTSSIAVYGDQAPPFDEEMTPAPIDPYGIAKYAVELDLAAAHKMFGLPYIIFRTHNVYGERQNLADPYRNVVGIFMRQIMNGQPMTIFGDGEQRRAFTHVSDVAPVIARSVTEPSAYNQVFNLGSDDFITIQELSELVGFAMGVEGEQNVRYLPARQEADQAYCSHDKARIVFGTENSMPLNEGLRRMARWAKSIGTQKAHLFDGVEVEKNLPPSWRKLVTV